MSTCNAPIVKILNMLVLISSLAIIVLLSFELLSLSFLDEHLILVLHLVFCSVFLADFFVRWYYCRGGWHFLKRNLFFLVVSVPYLNLVHAFATSVSHLAWIVLRIIPLCRGIYGVTLIMGWMTRNRITNLFATYLTILFTMIYFCSILFYFIEHGVNPMVKDYWDAFTWALMNVTTVGSNIFGVTKLGQSLAVILAAGGMIFFPIFTAYVTSKFQNKLDKNPSKQAE